MAHIGHPQGKIAFTTRSEAIEDGNKHLERDSQGLLILVAEDLLDHFEAASSCLKLLASDGKTKKKISHPFISMFSYSIE